MKQKNKRRKWTVLTVVFATFLVLFGALYSIAYSYEALLNKELGDLKNYRTVETGDGTKSTEYFVAKYKDADSIRDNSARVSEAIEAEGLVLLLNNGALPLKGSGLKVSLFGTGSVNINNSVQGMRGGVGGAQDNPKNLPNFRQALEEIGVTVNPVLWDFYTTGAAKNYGGEKKLDANTNIQTYYIHEAPWSVYDATITGSFASYGDAAIVVFTRDDTEGADMNVAGSDGANGNYLALSPEEKDLLKELTALKGNGTFKSLVVLLNEAAPLQMDFLKDQTIDVDAVMWIGNTGMTGIKAVAKALVGQVVPSGRASDTFAYDNLQTPAMIAWAANQYGVFSRAYDTTELDNTQKYYGVYNEGIYVGYRYYETRYEDTVMGRSNVGVFHYDDLVAFPFGSGLSYTEFAYSDLSVKDNGADGTYTVSVKVTNTGAEYSGKEVVQIYVQKPYTSYAVKHGMEVASVELCGYAKTGVIAPGNAETVSVTVEKSSFASYDTYGAGTYILDAGDYYLAAGKDAHDALNNILAAKGYSAETGMDADGDAALAWKNTVAEQDKTTFAVSDETGLPIDNKLAFADPNRNAGAEDNLVTYVSRSNWTKTMPDGPVVLSLTDAFMKELQSDIEPASTGTLPAFDQSSGLTLIMMRGKAYDDPDWDKLLDEMSYEELNTLLTTAYCITAPVASVAKPQTNEMDGPTYCKEGKTDSRFPCAGIWSSTFNVDLVWEVGEALANDCLFAGYNGMWIPGINIHRTPYGGRTHEYFSEDPFLTGTACAAEIKGLQEYGVIAYPKHYVFNDQEANRNGIAIWLNEQEAREIILRPWLYACSPSRGNAHGVMSSFNRAGNFWTSAADTLVNGILRDEFGFNGIIITDMADANGTVYMSCVDGITAGTDIWLSSGKDHSFMQYRNNATVVNAMREAAKRVMYNVVNYSAAMNGVSDTMRIERVYTWWEYVVTGALGLAGVLTLVSLICLLVSMRKKKESAE
ncbi:MAG: glycoside hydrolase family 3 C-terminal domain-containing protein [Lachnospiraceae bacterium]|nr:glycoside hydrolase family 3 C-terminal domain-containing protein [Lachnospiraceae bacterium]